MKKVHAVGLIRSAESSHHAGSWPWLWLAIAVGLLPFANGANTIALAAWLAPVFLLRFVRGSRKLIGLPIACVVLAAMFALQFRGMLPMQGITYYLVVVVFGIVGVLPYFVDRLLTHRFNGLMATLIFPTAWVTAEYLVSFSPSGSWYAIAYSQYGDLPLLQLLSVTGMWGITFLIGWFAAVCNQVWELGLASKRTRVEVFICASVIAAVFLLGGARLALFSPSAATVRVASISKGNIGPRLSDGVVYRLFFDQATPIDMSEVNRWSIARSDGLFARTEQEMRAGAKIVFWGEANARLLKPDEAALIARGRTLAKKYGAYLGMSMGVWTLGNKPPFENKFMLIQPDGQIAWTYHKTHPVPGLNTTMQVRGDGKLRKLDTPYGKLTAVICADADYPGLLGQAGVMGADIVLDPSNDWQAIDPLHTRMASFRAIEQGVNLVRQTSGGLSATFDYQGRLLAAVDDPHGAGPSMISAVPTKGVQTLYSRLGDWFAWLSIAVLVGLVFRGFRSVRRLVGTNA